MSTVQLKITHGNTLRKVPYPRDLPPSPYTALLLLIKQRFNLANPAQIELLVKDEDGDWVTVSSDLELQELFAALKDGENTLRMQIRTAESLVDATAPTVTATSGAPSSQSLASSTSVDDWLELSEGEANVDAEATKVQANAQQQQEAVDLDLEEDDDEEDPAEPVLLSSPAADRASLLREAEFPSLPSSSPPSFPDDPASPSLKEPAQDAPASSSAASSAFATLLSALPQRAESLSSHLTSLLSPTSRSALSRLSLLASSPSSFIPPTATPPADLSSLAHSLSALSSDISLAALEIATSVRREADQARGDFERFGEEAGEEVKAEFGRVRGEAERRREQVEGAAEAVRERVREEAERRKEEVLRCADEAKKAAEEAAAAWFSPSSAGAGAPAASSAEDDLFNAGEEAFSPSVSRTAADDAENGASDDMPALTEAPRVTPTLKALCEEEKARRVCAKPQQPRAVDEGEKEEEAELVAVPLASSTLPDVVSPPTTQTISSSDDLATGGVDLAAALQRKFEEKKLEEEKKPEAKKKHHGLFANGWSASTVRRAPAAAAPLPPFNLLVPTTTTTAVAAAPPLSEAEAPTFTEADLAAARAQLVREAKLAKLASKAAKVARKAERERKRAVKEVKRQEREERRRVREEKKEAKEQEQQQEQGAQESAPVATAAAEEDAAPSMPGALPAPSASATVAAPSPSPSPSSPLPTDPTGPVLLTSFLLYLRDQLGFDLDAPRVRARLTEIWCEANGRGVEGMVERAVVEVLEG
ncbi:hypothetical protein JCM6882_005165 [Rhodosporidiobolus microsporus]